MRYRIPALTISALLWTLLAPLAAGQTGARDEPGAAPLEVVVTIGMLGDLVEQVGGPCVRTTTLMGPGVDPHLYRASARDVQRLQRADVILYSGYALEGQLGDVLARFARLKPTLAVAEAAIERTELIEVGGAYGVDPHLWMDVRLWSRTVPRIAALLGEQHPDCAADIRARADASVAQLTALHAWVAEAIDTIPTGRRVLITAHDAFGYFGRAYGIEVIGIQGTSTESQAGIADIRRMAGLIAERQVPAVFVETTINPRTIQAVIEAAADQGQAVRIGGQLYSDAMGEDGTAGGTYVGMIHENTTHIVEALGGRLPPLPAALRDWAERWGIADDES